MPPPLVVESDLGVWHAEEAIKKGLDQSRVITIQLDASVIATGMRVLKREQNMNPETAINSEKVTEEKIKEAFERVKSRNQADMINWQNVYEGEVGDPYDENRFDVLINTDKLNESENIFEVSEAIKKAVFTVLAWRGEKSF